MSKIDKIIRNSLKDTPAVNHDINRELSEKFRETAKSSENNKDYEISVNHVEQYRRPLSHRIGAVAAALAVVVALGGGAVAMKGMFSVTPSSMTEMDGEDSEAPADEMSDEISEEESEEISEEASAEEEFIDNNSYDMSTKEGVYSKMTNSFFFFDQVSGKIVERQNYKENVCDITDFQFDLTTAKSYAYCSRFNYTNNLSDILNGEAPVGEEDNWISKGAFFGHINTYCNGEMNVWLYDDMTYSNVSDDPDMQPRSGNFIQLEDQTALAEKWRNVLDGAPLDDIDDQSYPKTGITSHLGNSCLQPLNCCEAGTYMYDFDTWDIVGDVTFLDRDCVQIAFNYNDSEATMYIDKETGCMLYYTYYISGNLTDYLVAQEISFNENAKPVPEIDMSQYSELVYEEYDRFEIRTNSHGQTYASAAEHICRSNDEKLPDLIAFGCGFIKKAEFFEIVGDESKTNDLRQAHEKKDDDVLIYTLNIYDQEGETVLDTVNYYGTQGQKDYCLNY